MRLGVRSARRRAACRSRRARRAARSGRRCSSSVAVDRPSPTSSMRSPTTATTTVGALGGGDRLGDRARRRARPGRRPAGAAGRRGSSAPAGSRPSVRMSAPRACVTVQSAGDVRAEAVEHGRDHLARVAVGHPVDLADDARPVAELGLRVVGVRADDRDRARAVAAGARPSDPPSSPPASGSVPSLRSSTSERRATSRLSSACSALPITAACRSAIGQARVLEQAELELQAQDPRDGARRCRPRRAGPARPPPARPRRTPASS